MTMIDFESIKAEILHKRLRSTAKILLCVKISQKILNQSWPINLNDS